MHDPNIDQQRHDRRALLGLGTALAAAASLPAHAQGTESQRMERMTIIPLDAPKVAMLIYPGWSRSTSRASQLKAPRFVNGTTVLGGICFCADCGGAMTLRTSGRGEGYRYYTCCTKARQGAIGCKGRSIPTDQLEQIVIGHVEDRLLAPDRVIELLGGVLERRAANADQFREHITHLRRQAADADRKLTRLYEAIEAGLADMQDDANLKSRVVELRTIRDAASGDADRAEARAANRSIELTPEAVQRFAGEAKRMLRTDSGEYRRHHLQALAQRVEVGADMVRISGSRTDLLRTLVAASGVVGTTANEVRSFVPKWLLGLDSNQRPFD